MESFLSSEAYSSDGSMKENQSDNALHSSPPERVNGNRSSSSEEQSTPVKGEKEETENLLYGGGHCRWVIGQSCKTFAKMSPKECIMDKSIKTNLLYGGGHCWWIITCHLKIVN